MEPAILVSLFVLGTAFGSFVSALTWRIHKGKDWVKGRSQCPNCNHQLTILDLVPIFSWLFLRGRCRYCKKSISWQYPAIEITMGLVFALSYLFWPGGVDRIEDWLLLITWLASSVGLMALLVYDARWFLLPNKLIYPTAAIAAIGRLAFILGFETDKTQAILQWILAVGVSSGLFWLLYIISSGKWIGFGDVRLGLITGTLLAKPELSFMMIFVASLLGSIYILPSLFKQKRNLKSQLPFGPFLIAATAIVVLFGADFIAWYRDLLTPY